MEVFIFLKGPFKKQLYELHWLFRNQRLTCIFRLEMHQVFSLQVMLLQLFSSRVHLVD